MTTRTEPDLISNFTYDWCPISVGKPCEAYADNGFYRALSYDTYAVSGADPGAGREPPRPREPRTRAPVRSR